MAFCKKCGKEIASNSQFCPNCGELVGAQVAQQTSYQQSQQAYQQPQQTPYQQPQQAYQQPQQTYQQPYPQQINQYPLSLLQQLSSKIKTNAIIWIVIACIQFAIGLLNLFIGLVLIMDGDDGTTNIIMGIFVTFVATANIINASKNFKYSRNVLINPVGVVQNFQPLGNLIGTLVYNLLFGGIIGIVGSIYAFILRSFVLSNTAQFQAIEADFMNNTAPQVQNCEVNTK